MDFFNTPFWWLGIAAAITFTFMQSAYVLAGETLNKIKLETTPALFWRALITVVIGAPLLIFFNVHMPDNIGLYTVLLAGFIITLNDTGIFKYAADTKIGAGQVSRITSLGIFNLIAAWIFIAEWTDLAKLSDNQKPLSAFMEAPMPTSIVLVALALCGLAVWKQKQDPITKRAFWKVWPLTLLGTMQAICLGIYVMRYEHGLIEAIASYIVISAAVITVGSFLLYTAHKKSSGIVGLFNMRLFKVSLLLTLIFTALNVSKYATTGLLGTPVITDLFGRLNPVVIRFYHTWIHHKEVQTSANTLKWQWVFFGATFTTVIANIFIQASS